MSGSLYSSSSPVIPPARAWRTLSIVASIVVPILSVVVFEGKWAMFEVSTLLFAFLLVAICIVIFVHGKFLVQLRREHRQTANALVSSTDDFQQMADNIQEVFWTIDAKTKETIYVNQAYETITGRSPQTLQDDPRSYEKAIHPDDRALILAKLVDATVMGNFDEKFRIVWPSGEVRWVWARGFPVRDADQNICRLVGTALDITAQHAAEQQVVANLKLAKNAWVESEALRKATLALTQDLRMDFVLDTLLASLSDLVPCECSRIWLLEGDTHLFTARETVAVEAKKKGAYPLALNAVDVPFLAKILTDRKSILLADTKHEAAWSQFQDHKHLRSWLCVPLVASNKIVGLLSAGHSRPERLTMEDVRRAELLAIPATAAIQNSRLYECASIYASELEKRVKDVQAAKQALEEAEESRKISDEKFQKVFRSSPVALFITTLNEGRILDVNTAFEQRHGYSRPELIGHTLDELCLWADPSDRAQLLAKIEKTGSIRDMVTRLRTKSGELKLTTCSADALQFDGQSCLLNVSIDVTYTARQQIN